VVVTRFRVQWKTWFTCSKQKLIVMLFLSYLFLSNKDSVNQTPGDKEVGPNFSLTLNKA